MILKPDTLTFVCLFRVKREGGTQDLKSIRYMLFGSYVYLKTISFQMVIWCLVVGSLLIRSHPIPWFKIQRYCNIPKERRENGTTGYMSGWYL